MFNKLTLEDIPVIKPFFMNYSNRTCDCTIGGAMMWRDYFNTHYAINNNTLVFRVNYINNITAFIFPIGEDINSTLDMLDEYCRKENKELIFCSVTDNQLAKIKERYNILNITEERNWFDYIYDSSSIVNLSGRKYSAQRNQINKFIRAYPNYAFYSIDDNNIGRVKEFFNNFSNAHTKNSSTFIEEERKVYEVLDNYGLYGLFGGILEAGSEIVGISIGEIIKDMLYVHIEKANTNYVGVYQMLTNMFAKTFAGENIKYINREEDVGDLGLRKSKMSYHPIELLKKYTVKAEIRTE